VVSAQRARLWAKAYFELPLALPEALPEAPPLAPPEEGDLLLPELPMEPLELELPELLGELGLDDGELLPLAALPLFALLSELEPEPALSRLQAAMPMARAKAVMAAVKVFIFMHLL
jgi:hypothetical protein